MNDLYIYEAKFDDDVIDGKTRFTAQFTATTIEEANEKARELAKETKTFYHSLVWKRKNVKEDD